MNAASAGFLEVRDVVKQYGEHKVIHGVSLSASKGEFVVFVGPSGCGKSTLLRLIAGLEEVSGGTVAIDSKDVTHVPPADRGVSMVFQSYALYPHMNVRDNMAFGLKMIKTPQQEIDRRVQQAAGILKLDQLMDRRPRQLSGGQRQRVAIGRSIVRDPKLFLFDEPLSNLDAELRGEMRVEIARLHQALGVTMVYVTHDQVEAMTLADRIVVLRAGRIEQIGTPSELYDHPVNTFVAGFIGSPRMNFLKGRVVRADPGVVALTHSALTSGELLLPVRADASVRPGDEVTFGVRPEHVAIGGGGSATLSVQAEYVENLGGTSQLYAKAPEGGLITVIAPGRHRADKGDRLDLSMRPEQMYAFDAQGLTLR